MLGIDKSHTGIVKLDFEHQQILETLASLQEPNIPKAQRILICERLLFYIGQHVEEEEKEIAFYNVPRAEDILEDHIRMKSELLKHLSEFIKSSTKSTEHIYEMVVQHILEYDVPMAEFIKSKQIS